MRVKIALVTPLVALLISIGGANATSRGGPQLLSLESASPSEIQLDSRIERQSWWVQNGAWDPNHTILANTSIGSWDINDHVAFRTTGSLNGQSSTTATWKHIWDYNPVYTCNPNGCSWWSGSSNAWGTYVISPSPNLVVEDCIRGRCFYPQPVYDSNARSYYYIFCGRATYTWEESELIPIPGSQAVDGTYGYGVPDVPSLTLRNQGTGTKATIKNITVGWGLSSDLVFAPGCSDNSYLSGSTPRHDLPSRTDHPFLWFGTGL